jgi:hypothetical protein
LAVEVELGRKRAALNAEPDELIGNKAVNNFNGYVAGSVSRKRAGTNEGIEKSHRRIPSIGHLVGAKLEYAKRHVM